MNTLQPQAQTFFLTGITLIAFAANSVLCRQALGGAHIDPIGFTAIRLLSGAIMLAILIGLKTGSARAPILKNGSWRSAVALLVYAIAFSYAYISLDAGIGALILFAAVQATMIGVGVWRGDRPSRFEWLGITVAIGGLVYLLSPGLNTPPVVGSTLMTVSGIAWGLYSLYGQGEHAPAAATAGNFVRAAPLMIPLAIFLWPELHSDLAGILLAIASGALASGIGYTIWYAVLPRLAPSIAATVQLTVPAIAAVGGIVFLDEAATLRLFLAGGLILGGVAIAVQAQRRNS